MKKKIVTVLENELGNERITRWQLTHDDIQWTSDSSGGLRHHEPFGDDLV